MNPVKPLSSFHNWLVALCLALAGILPSAADVILGSQTWDNASEGLLGWQSVYDSTLVSRNGSGGNPDGWLQVDFPGIDPFTPPGPDWYDLIRVPATNLFAGTWTTEMSLQFDFWAANRIPTQLAIRWQSLTNSYVWSYSVNVTSTQSWNTLTASLSDWQNWILGPGASEDMFLSDLSSVNWVGVYIQRNGADAQGYGLDNFNLMVPEPGEYAMLAVALAAAWVVLRRRRPAPGSTG